MTRPRVIIADENEKNIIPIQTRLIQEFLHRIDLEIITQRDYFEHFFAEPQKADILIVSRKFYDALPQGQHVSPDFVVIGQNEPSIVGQANVSLIYQDNDMVEGINKIIKRCTGFFQPETGEKRESRIVLVTSAKGGTGTTTLALGVSAGLARNNKKVLYLNASRLQSFQYLLHNQNAISLSEVYGKSDNPTESFFQDIKPFICREAFDYVPVFNQALISAGIDYSIFEKLALSARESEEYDYIIVDAESTFDEEKIRLIEAADKVLVVTEQNIHAVQATNAFVANIKVSDAEKCNFICNKFRKDEYNALTEGENPPDFTVSGVVEYFAADGVAESGQLSDYCMALIGFFL